jgi:hypothetical protein
MKQHEFFSHYYETPISQGFAYFVLPDFQKFIGYEVMYAHHTDILKNIELYTSQGTIIYMINIHHNMKYHGHFLFADGRGSWIEYLPKNIITLWKKKKCKIVIGNIWDDCDFDIFKRILDSFYKEFGTCENMYIWSTLLFKTKDIETLDTSYRNNLVHIPYAEMWSKDQLPEYIEPKPDTVKTKKFIKLVRRYTPGRILSHLLFNNENLNKLGFVSLPASNTSGTQTLSEYANNEFQNTKWEYLLTPSNLESAVVDQETMPDRSKSPYNNTWLGFPKKENLIEQFHQSYFSVIFESRYEAPKPYYFYTEKLIRAILYKHPFILMSTPECLEYLKLAGYKTFDSVWDESYDTIKEYDDRANCITKLVKNLCTTADLDSIEKRTKEITEHNYNNALRRIDDFKKYIEGLSD